ncbi:IclR family transcriptional regulator [Haloechinothrix halophila]|uniref:IclR family transcriptional regulator n=1 Tax=Haloechinothrix halophila TaxID=1069073 RepID=UPI000557B3F5|nr:IclR family transcriptional regulator [Haloechinothrix halophila]
MANSSGSNEPVTVQSVDRAIEILELLLRDGEAGISEIADELGVHKSTASRLVYTLQTRDLVEQHGERGRFTIGIGMLRFAGAVTGQIDLARLGTPLCESLAEKLGETVNIAVLDGLVAINVSQARGTSAVAAQNWTGQRTPLHATSSGKVLLASMAEQDQEKVLADELTAYTPSTVVEPDELRTVLKRVAEDGYATCFEELEPGLHAVAVEVLGPSGDVVAAISASGPAYRLSRKRIRQIARELRSAAAELSGQLGYMR